MSPNRNRTVAAGGYIPVPNDEPAGNWGAVIPKADCAVRYSSFQHRTDRGGSCDSANLRSADRRDRATNQTAAKPTQPVEKRTVDADQPGQGGARSGSA